MVNSEIGFCFGVKNDINFLKEAVKIIIEFYYFLIHNLKEND